MEKGWKMDRTEEGKIKYVIFKVFFKMGTNGSDEYVRGESETTVENIVNAYLSNLQSLKWVGGMLEFACSSEKLLKNPEMRKREILRIIEKYGRYRKSELKGEMKRRGLIE